MTDALDKVAAIKAAESALAGLAGACSGDCYPAKHTKCLCNEKLWPLIIELRGLRSSVQYAATGKTEGLPFLPSIPNAPVQLPPQTEQGE